MAVLTIKVHVAARAAILAGKTEIGDLSFTLTEHALRALPEDLRMELALAYETAVPIGADPQEPPVVEASLTSILPVLTDRAARRQQQTEQQRNEAARRAELTVSIARDSTAQDNARSRALRHWIEEHGDEEQRARLAEGFLPEAEILDAVTDELLDLPTCTPYTPMMRGEACDCNCAHRVVFTVNPPQHMDAFQFSKLQAVRAVLPPGAAVTPMLHQAACPGCACVPLTRLTARVTLPWHGWELVREVALR